MFVSRSLAGLVLAAVLGLAACAPTNANSTYTSADIGQAAQISYGTIVSARPVTMQGQSTGIGTVGGALIGSTTGALLSGRDPRARIIGAVGGTIVGGIVGAVVENAASTGEAVEFIIQEDNAPQPISVVQTNEDGLRPGERVVLTRGARARIARLAS
jgi:outer membrane lipoprotein SlyB